MRAWWPHRKDLSISESIEEIDSVVPAYTPGEAEGSFTRLWFYCKTSLSPLTVCQTAGKACLRFIGSCGSTDDGQIPLWSTGLVKGKGRNTLLKKVFISLACLVKSLSIHICFFFSHSAMAFVLSKYSQFFFYPFSLLFLNSTALLDLPLTSSKHACRPSAVVSFMCLLVCKAAAAWRQKKRLSLPSPHAISCYCLK